MANRIHATDFSKLLFTNEFRATMNESGSWNKKGGWLPGQKAFTG